MSPPLIWGPIRALQLIATVSATCARLPRPHLLCSNGRASFSVKNTNPASGLGARQALPPGCCAPEMASGKEKQFSSTFVKPGQAAPAPAAAPAAPPVADPPGLRETINKTGGPKKALESINVLIKGARAARPWPL